jgi:hypothetical protein
MSFGIKLLGLRSQASGFLGQISSQMPDPLIMPRAIQECGVALSPKRRTISCAVASAEVTSVFSFRQSARGTGEKLWLSRYLFRLSSDVIFRRSIRSGLLTMVTWKQSYYLTESDDGPKAFASATHAG